MVDYKLVLIRRLAIIALIFIISFIVVNIVMGYPLINILIDFAGLILMLAVLVAAGYRKVMVASLTMTIGLVGAISVASIVTYFEFRNNGTENLIMAMIVVIVAFFDGKLRTILFGVSFVLLILLKRYKIEVLSLPADSDFIVELIIVAVISCGIYFSTSFFKLGLVRNLDRVNNLNMVLGEQREALTELNDKKDELIGVVAHDLKSPLHVLSGMLPILKKGLEHEISDEQSKMLQVMQDSSGSMLKHIDQILDANRMETQELNLNPQKHDLSILLQKSIDLHRHGADLKKIRINAKLTEGKHEAVVDENCTRRVFENLLSNAIKYTSRGKSVHLSMETNDSKILIKFRDEGPGISAEDREMLFKKYQPLYARPTGPESSTGMGLFTVKKYLLAMNGTIDVESKLGRFTTFIVGFPKA